MGKDLLMKSFAVLKYLGLFSVNLIIIASVIACVSSAPYVSNKNTNHPVSEKKKYDEALNLYSRALKIWPGSPSALYNRALILKKLGRTPEELLA